MSLDRFKAIQLFCRYLIVINKTLEQVRFGFDLLRLATKLNSADSSAADYQAPGVDEIEATLENLRVMVARSAPVPAEVLKRTSDAN